MTPDQYTSLHINSPAKIRHAIFGAHPHWFDQLKQANLYCQQYEEELLQAQISLMNLNADLKGVEANEELETEYAEPVKTLLRFRIQKHLLMIRDTQTLFDVAISCRDEILSQFGVLLEGKTYTEIQELYSREALQAQQVRSCAADMASRLLDISPGTAAELLALDSSQYQSMQVDISRCLGRIGIISGQENEIVGTVEQVES